MNLYHCSAGKASWMQCPLHNQKVNKPSFQGASCQLAPFNSLNTQSTVLTNRSVMVASVVDGEWRWQPYQNLLNSVFIPYMSAGVIECRSIGSCSSSGLCAGLMITGLHFQLLFTLLRLIPGFRDPGSVLILGQVTQYGNPYLICIAPMVRLSNGYGNGVRRYGRCVSC